MRLSSNGSHGPPRLIAITEFVIFGLGRDGLLQQLLHAALAAAKSAEQIQLVMPAEARPDPPVGSQADFVTARTKIGCRHRADKPDRRARL